MQLTLDDAVISYDFTKTGDEQPPVLFLHGALGVRGHFDALRQRFPERSHIAVDFPSHGESEVKHGEVNIERLARDTLALLDALDVAQVDIIGYSMGGYVGLVLAHLAPGRVRSIVTLGTKFYWTEQAIAMTLQELDAEALRSRSQRYYDSLVAVHTAGGADTTLRLTHELITDFKRWQLDEAAFRATNVPLMISSGDRDTFVPPEEVARLYKTLDSKQNSLAILPNTPHPLQHLAVACFEQAVRQFWARTFPVARIA